MTKPCVSSLEEKIKFPDYLNSLGIVPGMGLTKALTCYQAAKERRLAEGLDGLGNRLEEYFNLGARFAKWRAVIEISDNMPTSSCIAQMHMLWRDTRLMSGKWSCSIVEPEILMDGKHQSKKAYYY